MDTRRGLPRFTIMAFDLGQCLVALSPADTTGANYACDYADIGGIMMPMRRRVYGYDDEKHKIPEPLLVAIDFHTVSFT